MTRKVLIYMSLITCRDVSLGHEGREVVGGLNFTVEECDYLCIVGENGSGKSTLLKAILHLDAAVMSGEISFGEGLTRRDIGYLPQQTDAPADYPASVSEVVMSGALGRSAVRPFYTRDEKQAASRCLERMGISGLAGRCFRELSGGQRQRVLLARALMAARRVLLLDEPVTGLDPYAIDDMYRLIAGLNRDDGMTVIMISHDIGAALSYAGRVLHIGRPVFFGTPEQYREFVGGLK